MNSRIICNTCEIADASPVIHCSVCCSAFHYKCAFPDLPSSVYEHIVSMLGLQWLCPDDRNLSVSKLLDRLSLMEQKLMERPAPFDEIFGAAGIINTKSSQTQTSPTHELHTSERRILRSSKRNALHQTMLCQRRDPKHQSPLQLHPLVQLHLLRCLQFIQFCLLPNHLFSLLSKCSHPLQPKITIPQWMSVSLPPKLI